VVLWCEIVASGESLTDGPGLVEPPHVGGDEAQQGTPGESGEQPPS
jgi:hypothetical protein